MKDDEKALFREKLTFEDTHKFALQNAKDIIACGFDVKKTFIYSDLEYVKGHFLMNVWEFSKLITFNQVRGAFGFNERLAPSIPLVLKSYSGRRETS
jgi:tryptophanyl-tRNA synthetase